MIPYDRLFGIIQRNLAWAKNPRGAVSRWKRDHGGSGIVMAVVGNSRVTFEIGADRFEIIGTLFDHACLDDG